ncbi:MAG TPA: sulfite exporter TauE/SafE family protein [Bradyrhizobium sp.]|jgi:hypothetical protein
MTTFFELISATPVTYLACFAAILISSATHRVTGQAFGLICAPLVALAAPSHIPALILLCGLPVMIYSFKGDWKEIRWGEISYAFVGRAVGAILAATIIANITDRIFISVCVGVSVLLGVAISLMNFTVAINPFSLITAGFMSGAMATLTSVGAPPMGLLYQRVSFGHVRATLNAFFLFGALASVGSLLIYRLISRSDFGLAVALLPAIWLGTATGDIALKRMTIKSLRPFTLILSVIAATALLLRALW